jgi:hypothetical protein
LGDARIGDAVFPAPVRFLDNHPGSEGVTFPGMLLLLACTSAPDHGSTPTSAWAPTPYDAAFTDTTAPTPSLDGVAAALDTWVPTLANLDVSGFLDAFWGATDLIDYTAPCPEEATRTETSEGLSVEWWGYDTTCESGTWFNGYGELALYDLQQDHYKEDARYTFMTGATIRQPNGDEVGGSSTSFSGVSTGDDWVTYEESAYGDFLWSGADADGSWVANGWIAWIDATAYRSEHGADELSLQGGLSRLDGEFDAINVASARIVRGECSVEPSGTTSLHTADGVWVVVTWDAWDGDTAIPDKCDGCGVASVEGVAIGTVCHDWSPLLDWEDRPW